MPYSKMADKPIIPGLDIDSKSAWPSLDHDDIHSLLINQMRLSSEKTNKVQSTKIMRIMRDQREKFLSARSELLDKKQGQLASSTLDRSTSKAKGLDEIRGLWIAMVQQREALTELFLAEENAAIQLELDREKGSVAHLSRARADIEEQHRVLATLD